MEEKRKIKQEKIYENGKLKYVIIPNYTKTDFFMSKNEIRFYKILILIVAEIREKYDKRNEKNVKLEEIYSPLLSSQICFSITLFISSQK